MVAEVVEGEEAQAGFGLGLRGVGGVGEGGQVAGVEVGEEVGEVGRVVGGGEVEGLDGRRGGGVGVGLLLWVGC